MAKVHIDPQRVTRFGNKVGTPLIKTVIRETLAMSKSWPYQGNPAWTSRTGNLYRHTTGQTYSSPSPHGYVRNDLPYALAVHQGTEARLIFAKKPGGMNFYWKRFDRRGRGFKVVKHPATKGSFFLTKPLQIVGRRHGFKVAVRIVP